MKNTSLFTIKIIIALTICLLTSCIKYNAIPKVTYTATDGLNKVVNDSLVLDTNATQAKFNIQVVAEAEMIKLTYTKDTIITNVSNAINQTTYSTDTSFLVEAGKKYYFTTTVGDKDENEIYAKLIVLVKSKVNTFSIELRSSVDTLNSSAYNTLDNIIYNATDAMKNSAKVDFVYYTDSTTKADSTSLAEIFAPASDSCAKIGPKYFVNAGFATKNTTLIQAINLTAKEFDNISDNDVLLKATGLTTNVVTNLKVGKVFAFQTVKGKKGLAKITDFSPGAKGYISLTIKIQK
jgi:hypothetical protein